MSEEKQWKNVATHVKINKCMLDTSWTMESTSFIIFPADKSMVEPGFTIVIRMCTVELGFTFGMILRVTVQHLQIDMWKTIGSKCLKNMSIEGKGFTETKF